MIKSNYIGLIFILFSIIIPLSAEGERDSGSLVRTGTLSYMEGEVYLNNLAADIGDSVSGNDVIRTGSDSYCEVVFDKVNIFRIEENTVTAIDWTRGNIDLQSGSIAAVFTKLSRFFNDDKEFSVSTPATVAGVRGTVFYMKVEDENNTYLCICNGELSVTGDNLSENIASDHHDSYRYTKRADSVTKSQEGMLYHDDDLMEKLARKVRYRIPWGIDKGTGY